MKRWKYALAALVLAGLGAAYPRLGLRAPRQPIAFPHNLHLQAGMHCADCHRDAAVSNRAGLPSVRECALCHQRLRARSPLIRQVMDYARRGIEIPWQRVYVYPASAHLRFRHNLHLAAGLACRTCHGDMRRLATARVWKPMPMGVCIACHRQHGAKTGCEDCHV